MNLIYLCGFMGCGKTTVGRAAACLVPGAGFLDLDDRIVEREGLSIPEIFSQKGEASFRDAETTALLETSDLRGPAVIATGGGALISERNVSICRSKGRIAFLDVPFEICYQRIRSDPNRPVAAREKSALRELYEKRRSIYLRHCDILVEDGTIDERAEQIAALLRKEL